jgi:hypothetical protein
MTEDGIGPQPDIHDCTAVDRDELAIVQVASQLVSTPPEQVMRGIIAELHAWDREMGGWEAPCWRRAAALLRLLPESPTPRADHRSRAATLLSALAN